MTSTTAGASGASWLNGLESETIYIGTDRVSVLKTFNPNDDEMKKIFIISATANTLINNDKLDPIAISQVIASRSQTEVVGDSQRSKFRKRLDQTYKNPAMLTITGFHDAQGQMIATATTDNNNQVLRDVGDPISVIPLAQRRSAGIKFIGFTCTVDFNSLVDATLRPVVHTFKGFLELAQGSIEVVIGGNQTAMLSTFLGPSNLRALTPEEFATHMVDHQENFVSLTAPLLGNTQVDVDSSRHYHMVLKHIIRKSLPEQVRMTLKHVCPTASLDPLATIRSVTQVITDANGNARSTSVAEYARNIQLSIMPFGRNEVFPADIVAIAANGLRPALKTQLETAYNKHLSHTSQDRDAQLAGLCELFEECTKAHKREESIQNIVQSNAAAIAAPVLPPPPQQNESEPASRSTFPPSGNPPLSNTTNEPNYVPRMAHRKLSLVDEGIM